MTLSIRARLLLWLSGAMVLLLSLFAFVVYEFLHRSLTNGFDAVLLATARTLAASVEQNDEGVKAEIDERDMPEFRRIEQPNYFQLWGADGTVLARSTSLNRADLDLVGNSVAPPTFRRLVLPDGRAGRAVAVLFEPEIDDESRRITRPQSVTLVVARDTADLDDQIRFLRLLLALATGGTVVAGLIVGIIIVRQGLRPLGALAVSIAGIRQDLSIRLPSEHIPAEVVPVVDKLNELLSRIEEAFCRERAFAADVAHELRTPLAGMRSTLEVAVSRPRSEGDYREAISDCLEIVRRMQAMVDNLFALARMESGQTAFDPRALDLQELVEAAWSPVAERIQQRGITATKRIPAGLACTADRDIMRTILSNILDNAAEYTNDAGHIKVEGTRDGGSVILTIENTGCRLSETAAHQVFDRFWRGDSSRAETGLHCGLGLALVQRAVSSLGGIVTAEAKEGVFSVHVALPASPACATSREPR